MSRFRPAKTACSSCPYRRDVPAGVWSAEEYAKLAGYDLETPFQPTGAFFCHLQNHRLCAGWVGCHDMDNSLGLRMAISYGLLKPADVRAALDYVSPVPLFASGGEAAAHGMAGIEDPSEDAIRAMTKVDRRQQRFPEAQ